MYSQDIIDRYRRSPTPSVADACEIIVGRRCYMDHEIKPRINDMRIVGPAVTVQEMPSNGETVPPTFAMEAIENGKKGDVLVIGMEGSERDVAVLGGLMVAGLYVKGFAGAVLDSGVRDVTEIRRDYGLPVYSRSVSPGTTVGRHKAVANNVKVLCGGIWVEPGDLIVADLDGVVVVPKAHVEAVLEEAESIDARETAQSTLIKESGSLLEGIARFNRI